MMEKLEKGVDLIDRPNLYKIRTPYLNQARRFNDSFLNLGHDYRASGILRQATSSELWSNPQQWSMYARIEGLIIFLIDSTKMIKKWFSIAHDKDTTNIL